MTEVHPAIQKYLTALAQRLKEIPGVVPEEGLADAQEFLLSEWESLCRRQSALSEGELYEHFVRRFGSPDDVAAEYESAAEIEQVSAGERPKVVDGAISVEGSSTRASAQERKSRSTRLVVLCGALAALVGCLLAFIAFRQSPPAPGYNSAYGNLSWAGRVVSFNPGTPNSAKANDPTTALGAPDCQDGERDLRGGVALGHGGELILEFTDVRFCDGEGPDLLIFEVGPMGEPLHVAVSRDGSEWIKIGRTKGLTSGVDLATFVKPGDYFRFIRLTDAKSGRSNKSDWPGADIDAVGAVHVVRAR